MSPQPPQPEWAPVQHESGQHWQASSVPAGVPAGLAWGLPLRRRLQDLQQLQRGWHTAKATSQLWLQVSLPGSPESMWLKPGLPSLPSPSGLEETWGMWSSPASPESELLALWRAIPKPWWSCLPLHLLWWPRQENRGEMRAVTPRLHYDLILMVIFSTVPVCWLPPSKRALKIMFLFNFQNPRTSPPPQHFLVHRKFQFYFSTHRTGAKSLELYSPRCQTPKLNLQWSCNKTTPRSQQSTHCWQMTPPLCLLAQSAKSPGPRPEWEFNRNRSLPTPAPERQEDGVRPGPLRQQPAWPGSSKKLWRDRSHIGFSSAVPTSGSTYRAVAKSSHAFLAPGIPHRRGAQFLHEQEEDRWTLTGPQCRTAQEYQDSFLPAVIITFVHRENEATWVFFADPKQFLAQKMSYKVGITTLANKTNICLKNTVGNDI